MVLCSSHINHGLWIGLWCHDWCIYSTSYQPHACDTSCMHLTFIDILMIDAPMTDLEKVYRIIIHWKDYTSPLVEVLQKKTICSGRRSVQCSDDLSDRCRVTDSSLTVWLTNNCHTLLPQVLNHLFRTELYEFFGIGNAVCHRHHSVICHVSRIKKDPDISRYHLPG